MTKDTEVEHFARVPHMCGIRQHGITVVLYPTEWRTLINELNEKVGECDYLEVEKHVGIFGHVGNK